MKKAPAHNNFSLSSLWNKYLSLLFSLLSDRAVFFNLLSKVLIIISGPFTALFIATHFSQETQGYYYTFSNLLTLTVMIELGLTFTITQFAGHEWSRLRINEKGFIEGDSDGLSRLASLSHLTFTWYSTGGVVAALGLGVGGSLFFSHIPDHQVEWFFPWIALCFLTGFNIFLIGLWALLEGCNQVENVYRFRFYQGIAVTLAVWTAILTGAKLWTSAVSALVAVVTASLLMVIFYRNFFKTLFLSRPSGPRISWKKDIFQFQWRIALSWMGGYLTTNLFTPVLLSYHGAVVAGQMGMTWSLVSIVSLIPGAWVTPRIPQFCILIAQKKYDELDRLFRRVYRDVICVSIPVSLAAWCVVYILYQMKHPLACRLLPPLPAAVFIAAQTIMAISVPLGAYVRAHKKEPYVVLSVTCGLLNAFFIFTLGRHYSALGMALGYFIVSAILLPWSYCIWKKYRSLWHSQGYEESDADGQDNSCGPVGD